MRGLFSSISQNKSKANSIDLSSEGSLKSSDPNAPPVNIEGESGAQTAADLPIEGAVIEEVRVNLETIHYNGKKILSKGSFGTTIILATVDETEDLVVIKKSPISEKNKSRELLILKQLQEFPHQAPRLPGCARA